jgi:hypothetical protein
VLFDATSRPYCRDVRSLVAVLCVLLVGGCADESHDCEGDTPRLAVGQSTAVTVKVEPHKSTDRPAYYSVSQILADHGFWAMPMRD